MNISEVELKSFVVSVIADLIEKPVKEIITHVDLAEYGVDSLISATLTEELNVKFGYEVDDIEDFINLSTIDDIVDFFVKKKNH